MKIELKQNSTIDFSKKVQSVKNTISQENVSKVLAMFTKIYSDEPWAILREYTSNAHDANVQSGTDKPIIIGLYQKDLNHDSYNPDYELVFQDNGLGMTRDFMLEKFTQITYSTSDQNNDFIGGFGLGSKSGLAYSDTVIYECIADEDDGKRYKSIWLLAKEDGDSSTSLLSSVETTEDTGVKVSIKVKGDDYSKFKYAAGKLIFFSNIYFDGKLSDYNSVKVQELNNFYLIDNGSSVDYNNSIVLGSVLYPSFANLPTHEFSKTFENKIIVPKFDISNLKVVHNRELIRDNESSRKVIEDKFKEVKVEILSYIESLFKDVETENQFSEIVKDNFRPSSLHYHSDTLELLFIKKFSLSTYSRSFDHLIKYYVHNNTIYGTFHKHLHYNTNEDKLENVNEGRHGFSRRNEEFNNAILIYDDLDSRRYLKQVRTLYKKHNSKRFLVLNKNSLIKDLHKLKFIKDRYFKGKYYKLSEIEKTNKETSEKEKFYGRIEVNKCGYTEHSYNYNYVEYLNLESFVNSKVKYIYFYEGRSKNIPSYDSYQIKYFFKKYFRNHNPKFIKLIYVTNVKDYQQLEKMETKNLIKLEDFIDSKKYKLDVKYKSKFKFVLPFLLRTLFKENLSSYNIIKDFLIEKNFMSSSDIRNMFEELNLNEDFPYKIKELLCTKEGKKVMSEGLEFLTMLSLYPEQILRSNDQFSMYIYDKTYRPEVLKIGLKYLYSSAHVRRQLGKYKINRQENISIINEEVKKLFKTTN